MGILRNSTWDAFSSYSSLDDELHHSWIKNFTIDLKKRVRLWLEQKDHDYDLDQVAFFFDKESMPANGSLEDELIEHMKASGFLLLFVGDNYLKSPWCGKELDWFSARFSGIPKEALKNMFLIALTPAALRDASKDPNLQKVKSNGIFQLAYAAPSKTPMEPHFPDEAGRLRTNPEYARLVDKIAETLADRFIETGLVGLPPQPQPVTTDAVMAVRCGQSADAAATDRQRHRLRRGQSKSEGLSIETGRQCARAAENRGRLLGMGRPGS